MAKYLDSLKSRSTLEIGERTVNFFKLDAVTRAGLGDISRLPFSMRVLLENLLRNEDGTTVTIEDIESVARWDPNTEARHEVAYRPARVLMQDFTGVPALVDLAAMREALATLGGIPTRINPLQPVDLVIDHSVQVDSFGSDRSFEENVKLEFHRNRERYQLLKWGQSAFKRFRVIPPGKGIVHQVNLEYIAPLVFLEEREGEELAYPDTLVGTDSHTPMINGLGVLGWGVGGIEAETAMLGQPISMLLPRVFGFKLLGRLQEGATATDLVLTVVQLLRDKGVVGEFVEFFGNGLDGLALPDRATIANMAPESGATICFFPVDEQTIDYLRFTGRSQKQIELIERYYKVQGLFRVSGANPPDYADILELDLGEVKSSLAGPTRPQDRIDLSESKRFWQKALHEMLKDSSGQIGSPETEELQQCVDGAYEGFGPDETTDRIKGGAKSFDLQHGSIVIAAITSCTNTSNPAVLVAAGLLAKKAVERGLASKPWVKTSLAPGSQVVTDYLEKARLMGPLQKLGFHLVAYGCTTCIGNSGPLPEEVIARIQQKNLVAVSVLSGNRNFEGRINQHVRANYLASPPLVVAYALAGTMDIDFEREPVGTGTDGTPVFLRDIWPSREEVANIVHSALGSGMFTRRYSHVHEGTESWRSIQMPRGGTFAWDPQSTYIRKPPFFDEVTAGEPEAPRDIVAARVLAVLGDSVTTDHISPAGAIAPDSPAAYYLKERGVSPNDFNSYGSRRGNHEVMIRGTFANIRLRNLLVPGTEGGFTRHLPGDQHKPIYEAAMQYKSEGVPLLVLAGKEYGSGSSRDWAAKGTLLLGIRAVLAQSFERIHRSNLVGMGVLPLEFRPGESWQSLGLTGEEVYAITGISEGLAPGKPLRVTADEETFEVTARLDTPQEVAYYAHGGMLQFVLRGLAAQHGAK